jgi:hypothetical protein
MTNESRMRQKRAYIERCKQAHMRKMGILYTQHRFVLTSDVPLRLQDLGVPLRVANEITIPDSDSK